MEFENFNCFFIDLLVFGRIKVISIVVEREFTPDITWQICFAYKLTDFDMIRGSTERYFLTDYIYFFILLNAPGYCFKPSLSRIFCINSSIKVLSPHHEGLSTHIFRTLLLFTFIIYKKKEIGFVAKFFSEYLFRPKVIPD